MKTIKLLLSFLLVLTLINELPFDSIYAEDGQLPEETIEEILPSSEPTEIPTDRNEPIDPILEDENTSILTESPILATNSTNETNSIQPIFDEGRIIEEGDLGGSHYTIADSGLNLPAAQIQLVQQNAGIATMMDTAQITRPRRMAKFYTGLAGSDNGWEYASMFILNEKTVFCIEPLVILTIDGAGNGPIYSQSTQFSDLPRETQILLFRILWYGYGHPLTGTSDEAWLATQLLIWKVTDPDNEVQWMNQLEICDNDMCSVSHPADISSQMDSITNLIENRDTSPSFASQWQESTKYELDWNETLTLVDDGSTNLIQGTPVLEWFNDQPEESHNGINIRRDGNRLLIDIDHLYYEGYNSDEGKTLSFQRKSSLFENSLVGNIIWISGNNQKIMSVSAYDPTSEYKLSFKLKTSNIEVEKLDEYYQSLQQTQGTSFWIGWVEDPTQQYRKLGDNDTNWTHLYDYNTPTNPDLYGEFDYHFYNNTQHLAYYPIMNEEGTSPREFVVGADGMFHIENLLPRNKSWWVKEVKVTNPYQLNPRVWMINTLDQNMTQHQEYVNLLRDVSLDIIKQDTETQKRINGATFEIYEIEKEGNTLDLSKEETLVGNLEGYPHEELPRLTYNQFITNLPNPTIDDSFYFNGHIYTLILEDENKWVLKSEPYPSLTTQNPLTFNQIPEGVVTGDKFSITSTLLSGTGNEVVNEVSEIIKEYEVIQVSDNTISVKWTDKEKQITLNDTSDPSLNVLPKRLSIGQDVVVQGLHYTILEITMDNLGVPTKVILNPAKIYIIEKDKAAIHFDSIPQAVKEGLETSFNVGEVNYTLESKNPHKIVLNAAYKETLPVTSTSSILNLQMIEEYINDTTEEGGKVNPSKERVTLDTIQIGQTLTINEIPYKVSNIISSIQEIEGFEVTRINQIDVTRDISDQVVIEVPLALNYEDVPTQVSETEHFTIQNIINPVYTLLSDENPSREFLVSDSSILEITDTGTNAITDGSVIGYLDIIQSDHSNQGGACENPYNPKGCPIGTVRDFTKTVHVPNEYTGIQYDEIQAALNEENTPRMISELIIGDTFLSNGIEYKVITNQFTNEPYEITVEFNGNEVKLVSGQTLSNYITTLSKTIHYTVTNVTPKEYVVSWDSAVLGKNTLIPDKTYHLVEGADTLYVNQLKYNEIPNVTQLKEGDSFEVEDMSFTVSYVDAEKNTIIVFDSNNQSYVLTPEQVTYTCPITYEFLSNQEKKQGVAYKKEDSLSTDYIRDIQKGDEFIFKGKTYTLLTSSDNLNRIVAFSEQANAPLTYSEMVDRFKDTTSVTVDGVTYEVLNENVNGEAVTILKGSDGKEYHYWRYQLTNEANSNEKDESTVDSTYINIEKQREVIWQDYLDASTPHEGITFTVSRTGKSYKVITIQDDHSVVLKNIQSNEEFTVFATQDESAPYETEKIYFIEKGAIVDLSTVLPIPEGKEIEYTLSDTNHATLAGSVLSADEISRFTVQVIGQSEKTPITMEEVKSIFEEDKRKALAQENNTEEEIEKIKRKTFYEVQDTFTLKDIEYTIISIQKEKEEIQSFTVTTPNLLDSTKIQAYTVHKEEDMAKKNSYEGHIFGSYTVVVTTSNQGRGNVTSVDALPMAQGTTGISSLRVTDALNHNVPIANWVTHIYLNPDGTEEVKVATTDSMGYVNTSDLAAGTYYFNIPNNNWLQEFVVYDPLTLEGRVKVNNLKWGRTYMACEVGLPTGYEYENEVCFELTTNYSEGTTNSTTIVENRLRKLDLKVIKIDQNGISHRLNGAYFTIQDLTDAKKNIQGDDESTMENILRWNDLPETFEVGTEFRKNYHEGNIQNYRIEAIEYFDLQWLPNEENSFTSSNSIKSVTVYNTEDNSKHPIILKPQFYPTPELNSSNNLETYVSGSIYIKVTEEKQLEKILWQDILDQLGTDLSTISSPIKKGSIIFVNDIQYTITEVWDNHVGITYNEIPNVENLIENDIIELNGIYYKVKERRDGFITLQDAQSMNEENHPIFNENPEPIWLHSYTKDEAIDAKIIGVSVESIHEEAYLYEGQIATTQTVGVKGKTYEISNTADFFTIIQNGVTDENGEIVVWKDTEGNPLEGTYYVREKGTNKVEVYELEPGVINLFHFPYGHQIEICETQAPEGYRIEGKACEVLQLEAEFTETSLNHIKENSKINNPKENESFIPKMGE